MSVDTRTKRASVFPFSILCIVNGVKPTGTNFEAEQRSQVGLTYPIFGLAVAAISLGGIGKIRVNQPGTGKIRTNNSGIGKLIGN